MNTCAHFAFQVSVPAPCWLQRYPAPLQTPRNDAPIRVRRDRRSSFRCSMRPFIEKLVERQHLTRSEAKDAMTYAVSGTAYDSEIAALLCLLAAKGETADEVSGIVESIREQMIPVSTGCDVLDIVGTGGDGASTVNISTAACVAAAAAGCTIAKHGNRSVSSKSGSADVLEALGVNLSLSPEGVAKCVEKAGVGFMFAINHHPSLKNVAPVRKQLKIRTVFNIIGPLLNPCEAKHIVLGVYKPALLDMMADALIDSGIKKGVVVHTPGLDEYSNTGVAQVVEINGTKKTKTSFDPQVELGMPRAELSDLRGGDAAENASIIRKVLSGELHGPITDAIALNAAVGCYVYGLDGTIAAAYERVKKVLESGEAEHTLNKWIDVSNS